MEIHQGIGASDGLVVGPARVWSKQPVDVVPARMGQGEAEERARLDRALDATREELAALRTQLQQRLGPDHAAILDAQMLLLEDEDLLAEVRRTLQTEGLSAEAAFARAMGEALMPIHERGDAFFKERMVDFRDLEQRVLRHLLGDVDPTPDLEGSCILVAPLLTPSDAASLDLSRILGFCLEEGGVNSHTAIIARSLGVPAVLGVRGLCDALRDGVTLALDGGAGTVHVQPDRDTVKRFQARIRRRKEVEERLLSLRDHPAETRDGHSVELSANIELELEIDLAMANGAKGIGLLRTEYFYFQQSRLPAEDDQVDAYRRVLERSQGDPVIFRALDVGGDKFITALGGYREYNPFLGWRGVRFLLSNRAVLRTQLRALYRTSAHGPTKIMFPMISDLDELRELRTECARVRAELTAEGIAHDDAVPIGIMIETPSAVELAPELARECDFFSIGTNDLTQYILAVDRTNPRVSHLHRAHHPAVLRAIRRTIDAAHDAGVWVGVCGEMAGNPVHAVLLVGMGIDELSTNASAIPLVKKAIRSVRYDQVREWAEEVLTLPTAGDVEETLRARAHERLRDVLN